MSQSGTRSVADDVVEELFARILDGEWPPGTRLPTERDLATEFDTSRGTIRAAIARLIEWRVIVTRQGSGARVLERTAWKGEVGPYVFRHLVARGRFDELATLTEDGFWLRRFLILGLIERVAHDLEGEDLSDIRAMVLRAASQRDEPQHLVRLQRDIVPAILERAGHYTSLWFLNSLAGAYLGTMSAVITATEFPRSYGEHMLEMVDGLEAGDAARARRAFEAAIDVIDETILAGLPEELARRLTPPKN